MNPFCQEVVTSLDGWCQTQVGEVIGNHAVVLFRHPPIEAAEPCFDVDEREFQRVCSQRAADRRIRVPLNNDHRRPMFGELFLEPQEQVTNLPGACPTTDGQCHVRLTQPQIVEEHLRQRLVKVLT
jgi:hypothetical protein